MDELDPTVIRDLRDMARAGANVPQMLHEIVARCILGNPVKLGLIAYMRMAFCLSLKQASPIAGWWSPDGLGELAGIQLNDLLMPEVLKNRVQWDSLDLASS